MNIISPHLYIQYVFWWLTSLIYQAPTYFIQLNLIDKMEQFDAMVVLMEITFQNGMSRNAVWLINVMARYFGSDSFCLNCLKYLNEYENTSIFFIKFHTFFYSDGLVLNYIHLFINTEQIVTCVYMNKWCINVCIHKTGRRLGLTPSLPDCFY